MHSKSGCFFYFCKMGKKQVNKIFEKILIIDVGAKGKSIAKAPDGKVIFVSNAVPQDIVDIQTTKQRSGYYEGKAIYFHVLSPKRVTPICEHFEWCGGCKWQQLDYPYQLFYKEKEVLENLKRIGHLELPANDKILGCQDIYFYRNKMEFSFASKRWLTPTEIKNQNTIASAPACGFHISGMWDKILDIDNCYLQEEPSNSIRNFVKDFAIKNQITFFNPKEKEGLLRTLMIRISSIGEIMVLIQFYKNEKNKIELVMNAIKEQFPEITSLLFVVNTKDNDTIYDQKIIVYNGKDHIVEKMEDLHFKINAKSFYQTNSAQAYELYKIVRDFANLQGTETVFDLYSGTGTIAQFVAKKAKKVIGIESVPEAIEDANINAKLNNINNVFFNVGDMKSVFNDQFIAQHGKPDLIITDPPRDGMHAKVVEQILKITPQRIIYVSCNAATQARDLALMREQYKVIKIQPVDMFPQTHHVENVVLLEKINLFIT